MKAVLYIVKVSDSVLDELHGAKYPIAEIFVPKLKIAFNEKKGMFATSAPCADDDIEIVVPAKLAKRILEHVKERGYLEGKIHHFFREEPALASAVALLHKTHEEKRPPKPPFITECNKQP